MLDQETVAEHLQRRADDLVVEPPRWADLEPRLRGIRRRRRRRRAGAAAGSVVAVCALLGGVQAGMLPYPTWAPAVQVAATPPSALSAGPTRGTLADDDAWLEGLAGAVAAERWDESGGESWSVGDPDDVDVIVATDVGDLRVALIEAPYRWGVIAHRQQTWYLGRAGAAPEEMEQQQNGDVSPVAASSFSDDNLGQGADSSVVLVVTPDRRPVTLLGPPVYAADGTVSRPREQVPALEPGLHVWVAPDGVAGALDLEVTGWTAGWLGSLGTSQDDVRPERLRPPGGASLAADQLHSGFWSLRDLAGVGGAGDPLVLWEGGTTGAPAAVIALRLPSGALVVGAGDADPQPDGPGWLELDTARVLPAGDPADVVLAWQVGRTTWIAAEDCAECLNGETTASGRVGVLGPESAERVELLDRAGGVVASVRLASGGAVVDSADGVVARFLDAEGAVVAETDVTPFDDGWAPLYDR